MHIRKMNEPCPRCGASIGKACRNLRSEGTRRSGNHPIYASTVEPSYGPVEKKRRRPTILEADRMRAEISRIRKEAPEWVGIVIRMGATIGGIQRIADQLEGDGIDAGDLRDKAEQLLSDVHELVGELQ